MKTLVLLHGYGVRGFFFEPIKTMFESRFNHVFNPDIDLTNVESALDSSVNYFENLHIKYPESEIYIIGHSLGGILASIIAHKLGVNVINKIAVIASPYSTQKLKYKRLIRFLIVHKLIPSFVSRPRFFSKNHTPKSVQKKLWKQVVSESEEMVDELLADEPFHLKHLHKLEQECIVIGSEYDKIVPIDSVKAFFDVIDGKEYIEFPESKKISHNDFITGPMIAQEISDIITTFFLGKKEIWD